MLSSSPKYWLEFGKARPQFKHPRARHFPFRHLRREVQRLVKVQGI
jgi:hypothetical protein